MGPVDKLMADKRRLRTKHIRINFIHGIAPRVSVPVAGRACKHRFRYAMASIAFEHARRIVAGDLIKAGKNRRKRTFCISCKRDDFFRKTHFLSFPSQYFQSA